MKKLIKTASIIFLGCMMMSVSGYAEEPGIQGDPQIDEAQVEPSAEILERQEAIRARSEARLEAKKEKARAEREARGEDAEEPSDPNMQGDAEE